MLDTVVYTYGDDSWGDLLTAYDGAAITYDELGNPLNDGTWIYTWERGRQLASMSDGTTTWTYTYDADGMRTSRSNGTDTYTYVYNGGLLTQMTKGNDTLFFTYDAMGMPATVTHNGTVYFYLTTLQGDVLAIVDANNNIVAEYITDAWGKVCAAYIDPNCPIAELNPLIYRGYVYDIETELYYLQSRYYSPEIGRFINADKLVSTEQDLLGNNMFCYCLNNPVIRSDPTGEIGIIACTLIGLAIGAVIGGGIGAVTSYVKTGSVSTKSIITGAVIGGIVGAAVGFGVGIAIGASGAPIIGSGGKNLLRTIQSTKINNTSLSNWIKQCFRAQGKVGNGGLSDAIRYELRYGKMVGGKSHIIKGQERLRGLQKIIRKGGLSAEELALAKLLLDDLQNALNGK